MEIDITTLLGAIVNNEGGEYILPTARYDELLGMGHLGIGFDVSKDQKHVRLYMVNLDEVQDDVTIPTQG
jgi:hypothetical protein